MARRRRSPRRRSYRRRRGASRTGGAPASVRGFVSRPMLTSVAATAGGFIAANALVGRLPAQFQSETGRILGKALIGVVAGLVLNRVNRPAAMGVATGAMASAAIDAYQRYRPGGGGAAGLGYLVNGPAGPAYMLGNSYGSGLAGMYDGTPEYAGGAGYGG